MSLVLELQWRWGDDVMAVQHWRNVDRVVLLPQDAGAQPFVRARTAFVPVPPSDASITLLPGNARTFDVGGLALMVGWVEASRPLKAVSDRVDVLWTQAVGAVAGMAVMLAGLARVLPAPAAEPEPLPRLKPMVRAELLPPRPRPKPRPVSGGVRNNPAGTVGQQQARAPHAARPKGVQRVDAALRAHNQAAARGAGVLAVMRNSTGALGRVLASDLGGEIENSLGSLTRGDATVQAGSGGVTSRGHGPGGGGNAPLGLGQLGSGTGRGPGGPDVDLGQHVKVKMPTQGCVDCLMGGDALSRAEVERVVRRHLAQISYCYEKELQRNPNLAGKIVAHWTIAPGGNTMGIGSSADTMGDDAVAACVNKVIARMRFPQPRGGTTVEVNYPFVFQQAGN